MGIDIKLTPTTAMLVQAVIEAAILRLLRDIKGKTEKERKEMLDKQKARNKRLIASIEKH